STSEAWQESEPSGREPADLAGVRLYSQFRLAHVQAQSSLLRWSAMPKLSARGRTRALVFSFGTAAVLASGAVTGGLFAQARQRLSPPASQPTAAAIAPLVETQNAFAAVAAQVTPAVVSIHVEASRAASQGAMPDMQDFPDIPGFPGLPFGRG